MGVLDLKCMEYLFVANLITPIFHHLPKVHKQDIPVQECPIAVGIGSLLERLSEWVDSFLQPLVIHLPGYIEDTGHVLAHVKKIRWSSECTWITVDVKSLYSCIPHHLVREAVRHHLTHYSIYSLELQEFTCMRLSFCWHIIFFYVWFTILYPVLWCFYGSQVVPLTGQSLHGVLGGDVFIHSKQPI